MSSEACSKKVDRRQKEGGVRKEKERNIRLTIYMHLSRDLKNASSNPMGIAGVIIITNN